MTVEEIRRRIRDDDSTDRFPAGMRVLAVDDDPTCLMLLEALLRRCQYHVTTTNQAATALKLLRENKNKFDLVISDVDMPDMDGFKLLELVGLEMDLPVIMLSAHSDTKLVMKGITHGACDYLLKPVRLEELKNIWQHVIRRRKFDYKDHYNSDNSNKGEAQGLSATGNMDQNGKLIRKRKDQNEDEDEECEDNEHENEDPSSQKKPRVVWSVELHRKFVSAVNQLGIDKAVPKRILDLMGVEKLTRENVASHLQKYRLYLKRISCVTSQQVNMVAALGGKDSSYLRMGSLDGFGDFHAFAGSGHLSNAPITSFPPSGMLGRLNSPSSLGLRGLSSSGMIQMGHTQNMKNSINDLSKVQQVLIPGNQNGNVLQGMPTLIDDPMVFPVSSGFVDSGGTVGSSSNSIFNVPNNPLILQGHTQRTQSRGLRNQPSIGATSINPETFDAGGGASSRFSDQSRCNDGWQSNVPVTGFPSNALPLSDSFSCTNLSRTNLNGNISSMASHIRSNPIDTSPTSVLPASLQDSRRDTLSQAGPVCNSVQHDSLLFSSFGNLGNGVSQNSNFSPKEKHDYTYNSNMSFGSLNSTLPTIGALGSPTQSFSNNQVGYNRQMDVSLINQSNSGDSFFMQHNEVDKEVIDPTMKLKDGFVQNSCGSLEDIMRAMIKQECDDAALTNGNIGCDIYPLETCM